MDLSKVFLNHLKMEIGELYPFIGGNKQHYEELSLSGLISLDSAFPKIRIVIQYRQDMWSSKMPSVRVVDYSWLSPFFKGQDTDMRNWHRYSDGRLCWIHPQTWRNDVCAPAKEVRDAERAAAQLVKNVTVLLRCHLEAYRRRYLKWRKCWDFHPHGN